MRLTLALLAPALAAAPAAQPPAEDGETIVVTGERIVDFEQRVRACLARGCPVNEDVDASLALAEAHFLNGDYAQAERAVRASLDRNAGKAAQHPEAVADLWRSAARVQAHAGREPHARRSARNVLRALEAGIAGEDHRHFTARLEMADFLVRRGDFYDARGMLKELRHAARGARREDVVRMADMRLLRIAYVTAPADDKRPLRRLQTLAASSDPARRYESVSAKLMLASIYRARGDKARSDALLASIPANHGPRRALLFNPPYRLPTEDPQLTGASPAPSSFEDRWIDVAFWIRSDGRVEDVEVVRSGAPHRWAASLLRSIEARLYGSSEDPTPHYRLERYTYVLPYVWSSGERRGRRYLPPRVEYLDLTADQEPGSAPPPAVPASPTRSPGGVSED